MVGVGELVGVGVLVGSGVGVGVSVGADVGTAAGVSVAAVLARVLFDSVRDVAFAGATSRAGGSISASIITGRLVNPNMTN